MTDLDPNAKVTLDLRNLAALIYDAADAQLHMYSDRPRDTLATRIKDDALKRLTSLVRIEHTTPTLIVHHETPTGTDRDLPPIEWGES